MQIKEFPLLLCKNNYFNLFNYINFDTLTSSNVKFNDKCKNALYK